jgi:hypothetical protein
LFGIGIDVKIWWQAPCGKVAAPLAGSDRPALYYNYARSWICIANTIFLPYLYNRDINGEQQRSAPAAAAPAHAKRIQTIG